MKTNQVIPIIRAATLADQAIILSLVLENNLNPFDLRWNNFIVAIADNDRVVGCGQIKQHGSIQELASLVVARDWQGKGVSNLLMQALLSRAGRPLWLMCESPLVTYYQRIGFQEKKGAQQLPTYFRGVDWVTQMSMSLVFLFRGTYLAFMVLDEDD